MKLNINKQHFKLLELSMINSLIITFLLFFTVSYWQKDGLSLFEISFMAIIGGIYFFIVTLFTSIIGLNSYIRSCLVRDIIPLRRIIQISIFFFLSFLIFIVLDTLLFLIDDSISIDYAKSLAEIAKANNQEMEGLEDFKNFPFSIQNGITTLIFGFLGSLLSLAFLRKNGQLLPVGDS
ncbi:MAG: hypothetical protein H0X63_06600 [Flavobacteriales bacterium]|nr:hypothetical protein [Flavobacteriales bacterium]